MAARPLWTGQLRLSLVAMVVKLYSATRTGGRIRFRQIHGPGGKPIRYKKVVPGIGPVDKGEIMKGYELDKTDLLQSIGDDYVPEDLLEVATTLIDNKTSAFDFSRFTDNHTVAMHEKKARSTATSKKRKRA